MNYIDKKKKFRPPGWRMTPAQIRSHWQMFARICDALDWPADEQHRRLWYEQSGIGRVSIKTIGDPEYDKIKAFYLSVMSPASVDAQLRQLNMPKTRLLTAIRQLAPDAVIASIARDKFALFGSRRGDESQIDLSPLETLDEKQLTDLRNTLQRWSTRKAREQRETARRAIPCAPPPIMVGDEVTSLKFPTPAETNEPF